MQTSIIPLVSGAGGGNAAGALLNDKSLEPIAGSGAGGFIVIVDDDFTKNLKSNGEVVTVW